MFFLISFLFLLLFTYSFKPAFFELFKSHNIIFSNAEYSVYCLDIKGDLKNCNVINNGNGYIVKTDINLVNYVKSNVVNVLGESVKFKSAITSVDKLVKFYDINSIKRENVDNIICLYGYSNNPSLSNSISIDNQMINIQIAFSNGYLTVGTPIILGDY